MPKLTELELVEQNETYASEDEVSEVFDRDIAPYVIEQYGEDDTIAMREEFNNWTDELCKSGVLHELQYNAYCYVGKYSD